MTVSPDLVVNDLGFSVSDLARIVQRDAGTLTASSTFNFLDLFGSGENGTGIEFTGTLPAGRTINAPLNFPVNQVGNYFFNNTGDETPAFSGYTVFTNLPTHEAGKSYHYQFKKLPSGLVVLWGTQEGGATVTTPAAAYTIPAVGVEVVVGNLDGTPIYRQRWTGSIAGPITPLTSAVAGSVAQVLNKGGDMVPVGANSNQRWPIPYVNANTALNVDIQKHDNGVRILAGTQVVSETPAYDIWVDYTKV